MTIISSHVSAAALKISSESCACVFFQMNRAYSKSPEPTEPAASLFASGLAGVAALWVLRQQNNRRASKGREPPWAPRTGSACSLVETEQRGIVSRHPYQMNSAQLSWQTPPWRRGKRYLFSLTVTPGSAAAPVFHATARFADPSPSVTLVVAFVNHVQSEVRSISTDAPGGRGDHSPHPPSSASAPSL